MHANKRFDNNLLPHQRFAQQYNAYLSDHPTEIPDDYNPFDSFIIPVSWLDYPPDIALKTSTAKMSTPKKSSSKKTPSKSPRKSPKPSISDTMSVLARDLGTNLRFDSNEVQVREEAIPLVKFEEKHEIDVSWGCNEMGMFGPPVKATLEHMDCIDFKNGSRPMEMQAKLFKYQVNEITKDTTNATAFLVKNAKNKTGICTIIPSSWQRFSDDKEAIQQYANIFFGKSKQRDNAFNRMLGKYEEKFEYNLVEFFTLPDLPDNQEYSTCVFNSDGERHQLQAAVNISKGGKSKIWLYFICIPTIF